MVAWACVAPVAWAGPTREDELAQRGLAWLGLDDRAWACDGLPPSPGSTQVCLPLVAEQVAEGALAVGVERVDQAWELWVDGPDGPVRVAAAGDPTTGQVPRSGRPTAVALPDDARGADGAVRLVVRGWLSPRFLASGGRYPWDQGAWVGAPGLVAAELSRVVAERAVTEGQPRAIFTLVYLALAAWHLMTVRLRRDLGAYGWYGLTFATISAWSAVDLGWRLGLVSYDGVHASRGLILVATALYLRFVWVLLRREAPPAAWRAVELAVAGVGAARLLTPWCATMPWIPSWLILGHLAAAGLVAREAARGGSEARVLAGGAGVLALGVGVAAGGRLWGWELGAVGRFAGDIGATALAFAMALALGRRYAAALEERDEANHHLRRTLSATTRFVPFGFLRELGSGTIDAVSVGMSVEKEMSVLFADVRGFTARCEAMTPEETFAFVNRLVARLEPVVTAHGGFVDKFIGDAIMAVFPDQGGDAGAPRAVAAGVAMLDALRVFNEAERLAGREDVAIGVGVHTGTLRLGTVGTAERMDGTVLGDTVNVAARVEAATRDHGVPMLVTEATARKAPGVALDPVGRVTLKGKVGRVGLLRVVAAG